MKLKFFTILVLVSLLLASSQTVLAQGRTPPTTTNDTASLPRSVFGSPPEDSGSINPTDATNNVFAALTTPLVNGNFEQGRFVGWSEYSNWGYDLVRSSAYLIVPPYSGSWAAWLGGADLHTSSITQNNILITSPTHLQLMYWVGSQDYCGYDYGYVIINGNHIYSWNLCEATNTYGWVPLDLDLAAYNGQTVSIAITVITDDVLNSNLFIDDVSLYGTFADVPFGHWSESFILRLYGAGVTTGCGTSPLLYCPNTTVTRDQMAVFLLRAKNGPAYSPPAATGVFLDVPISHWAAPWIEALAAEGITAGCGGGNYCPSIPVTRDQMAVFLLRAEHGSGYGPPLATGDFQDVPMDHWAAAWIEQLAAEGITGGCGTGIYCPATPVTRDQMAVFLVRTFNLP